MAGPSKRRRAGSYPNRRPQQEVSAINSSQVSLSLSRWNVYDQCPFRYQLRYVDRATPTREIVSKFLTLGSAVHAALAQYHKLGQEARTRRKLLDLLDANWVSKGFASPDEEAEFKERARKMLEQYHFDPQDRGETIMAEETLTLISRTGRGRFIGRVDRAVRHEDGSVELIDYKTGRTPDPEDADPEHRFQLLAYALLFRQRNGGKLPDAVSAYYLENNRKFTYPVTEEGVREAGAQIGQMFRDLDAATEFNPRPSARCRWDCEFFGGACTPDLEAIPEVEEWVDF